MKRKTTILLSSIMASALIVGGAFAAGVAVTDNANPFGVNISPGTLVDDQTDYITLKWGDSTSLHAVGDFQLDENRKVGVVVLESTAAYTGKFSITMSDVTTADKAAGAKDLLDYINVYVYEEDVNLTDQGALPSTGLVETLGIDVVKDSNDQRKLSFDLAGSTSGTPYSIFVNVDNSAIPYFEGMSQDKVYLEVDWAAQSGHEATGKLVYTYKPNGWGDVYVYSWQGNDRNAKFPGLPMVNIYDNVYRLSIPAGHGSVIFSDGNGENTTQKTGDIVLADTHYGEIKTDGPALYWDGDSWETVPPKEVTDYKLKVNGADAEYEDISSTSPNDHAVFSVELEVGNKLVAYNGTTALHLGTSEATEFTAPANGTYTVYINSSDEVYISKDYDAADYVSLAVNLGEYTNDDAACFINYWGGALGDGSAKVEEGHASIDKTATGLIVVRCQTGATEVIWGGDNVTTNVFNQSVDITDVQDNLAKTLTFASWSGGTDGKSTFNWVA